MCRPLLTALAVALTLVACASDPPTVQPSETSAPAPTTNASAPPTTAATDAATEAAAAEARCQKRKAVPIQDGGHLVGNQDPPVPYNSTPPTSGWHASGDVEFRIAPNGKPLTEPQQVTVLELQGVVVSFNELPKAEVKRLADFLRSKYEGFVAMTRYDRLEPGQVALTAWGAMQLCDGVNLEVVDAFIQQGGESAGH